MTVGQRLPIWGLEQRKMEQFGPYRIDVRERVEGPVNYFLAHRAVGADMYRPCRLRRLDLRHLREPDMQLRLLDEARLVIGLKHPGIIATQDFGILEDELFLEEELVGGTLLKTILEMIGPLRQGICLVITLRLAEVLSYAHTAVDAGGNELSLVHRNLIPAHVHITPHGETKLSGFGMAHFRGRLMRTSFGAVRDSLGYVSPEELLAEPLTHRSDLYGLGVLMYEMLTGELPFQADNLADARQRILDNEYSPIEDLTSGIDGELAALIDQLLQRDPEQRPEDAAWVWGRIWDLWRSLGSPEDEASLIGLVAAAEGAANPSIDADT